MLLNYTRGYKSADCFFTRGNLQTCAATVCERVGKSLVTHAVLKPASDRPNAARSPAPPAPTTTASNSWSTTGYWVVTWGDKYQHNHHTRSLTYDIWCCFTKVTITLLACNGGVCMHITVKMNATETKQGSIINTYTIWDFCISLFSIDWEMQLAVARLAHRWKLDEATKSVFNSSKPKKNPICDVYLFQCLTFIYWVFKQSNSIQIYLYRKFQSSFIEN